MSSNKSGSHASSRSNSPPTSSSPRIPSRNDGGGGGLRDSSKSDTPNGVAKTGEKTTRTRTGGGGGGKTTVKSPTVEKKSPVERGRVQSPSGERKTSVSERKPSPLAQRRTGQEPVRKTSTGTRTKSPTGASKPPRSSGNDKGVGKVSPNSVRKQQPTAGKPPSGVSGGKSSTKTPIGGTKKVANGGTQPDGHASPIGRTERTSTTGSNGTVKKTAVSSVKKSAGSGGRESPIGRPRKTSQEHKAGTKSADSSPAIVRRSGSMRRSPGSNSSSPGVVRRSSTLRRTGSSGSIPVTQRPMRERKAESISPKIERRTTTEKRASNNSPRPERKSGITSSKSDTKVTEGDKKMVKSITPGAVARRSTGEGPGKLNPAGRRSIRSHSEANLLSGPVRKTAGQSSSGRKISTTTAVGRGSPTPSSLAGKAIILSHSDLQGEERVKSTLKLLGPKGGGRGGGRGGGGAKSTSKGPAIKSIGVTSSSSGRSTPSGRVSSPSLTSVKSSITRTSSGSSIPHRSSGKSTNTSRTRLRSSDDILKTGRHSPAAAAAADITRAPSPLSITTSVQDRETGKNIRSKKKEEKEEKSAEVQQKEPVIVDKVEEKESNNTEVTEQTELIPEKQSDDQAPLSPTERKVKSPPRLSGRITNKLPQGVRGLATRPSCRNTQVKSRIANWKKKEEEGMKYEGPSVSPVPPSPLSTTSPKSPSPNAHQMTSEPSPLTSPPTSPLATSSFSPSYSNPVSPQRRSPRLRSESPTVVAHQGTPVKSRIAMWAEREARSSQSPHRSPSPKSNLRRQSPIDKKRSSPAHSIGRSRESSVESNTHRSPSRKSSSESPSREINSPSIETEDASKETISERSNRDTHSPNEEVNTGASPARELPAITIRDEAAIDEEKEQPVYDDIEVSPKHNEPHPLPVEEPAIETPPTLTEEAIYSTIPDIVAEEGVTQPNEVGVAPNHPPKLNTNDEIKIIDIEGETEVTETVGESSYNRPAPVYTEIDIMTEETKPSEVASQMLSPERTPKGKRRWLPSPRFGRRKSSPDDHNEGAASDREEKKSEGFMKKITRIGSKSAKDKHTVNKTRIQGKVSYDSDSIRSSSPEESVVNDSRVRSSSDIPSDSLRPDFIPRSNSYSPSPSHSPDNTLTDHQNTSSQRVISSDPALSDTTAGGQSSDTISQKEVSQSTQNITSLSSSSLSQPDQLLAKPATVTHYRKSAPPSKRGYNHHHGNEGGNPLSSDIRSIIDNLGDDLEFCTEYSRKISLTSGEQGSGSAPSGLRLPVPFELGHGSSHPNLKTVGFKISDTTTGSREIEKGGSDSSTASEGEEQVVSEKEEDGDMVYPMESSLDRGRFTRYEKKRRASDNSAKISAVDQSGDALVVTSLMYADAVWDRVGMENDELSFRVGDVIEILDMSDDTWWQGSVREKSGWFPSSFVRLRVAQEEEEDDDDVYAVPPDAVDQPVVGGTLPRMSTMPAGDSSTYNTMYGRSSNSKRRMTIRRKDSYPSMPRKLTPTEVRSKVVEEILNTERDYVKHLEDIIEGFLKKCRLNTKLFDQGKIETIFSNLESLYRFQLNFLHQLEERIVPDHMEESQIGQVFVHCRDGFGVYSEYCNNHPHAVNEMCVLQKKEQYAFFFESCRLLRNLQNIPLEGFLLLPVQKICKYPLQLSELLKYTSEDHPDRGSVEAAVEAMRQVATHINEGKRRLENIGRIGKWQDTIDGWKGPDIVETSTEMIHSSELHKISKGHSQERHFFLFDNQLIYCKKDAIGGRLSYKGRLAMDKCHIIDIPDGQETHSGVPVRNAWKMDNQAKGKEYIIFAKSADIKSKWMDAFQKEKERVSEDRVSGFSVSLKMRRAAAALSSSTAAATVSAAKRRKSFNKKQVLRVNAAFTESVDTGMRNRVESSPAREKKLGKFSIMKQIF